MTAPSFTAQYDVGPVQPYVLNAANLIGPMFGIKTIYGWRKTDPFPDHPSGHALDFMTPSSQTGDQLADYLIANANNLGIKYLIWNRRYWSPSTGWQPYTATTNPHTDHVHVTFLDQPGPWIVAPGFTPTSGATLTAADSDTCAWSLHFFTGDTCIFSKKTLSALIGSGLMTSGVVVAIIGVGLLVVYGLGKGAGAKLLPGKLR